MVLLPLKQFGTLQTGKCLSPWPHSPCRHKVQHRWSKYTHHQAAIVRIYHYSHATRVLHIHTDTHTHCFLWLTTHFCLMRKSFRSLYGISSRMIIGAPSSSSWHVPVWEVSVGYNFSEFTANVQTLKFLLSPVHK